VKSEASFDPQKLTSFQSKYMNDLPFKQKAKLCLPFLQKAGLVSDPPACEIGARLQQILEAAGDRIVMAGDILKFSTYFESDQDYEIDEKAFQKRLLSEPTALHLINEFNVIVAIAPQFTALALEQELKGFCEQHQASLSDLTNPLRVALTGGATGFSLFHTMEILGRQSCIERINRALEKANFFDRQP
jgi:glutamyl-tRNA synthetase